MNAHPLAECSKQSPLLLHSPMHAWKTHRCISPVIGLTFLLSHGRQNKTGCQDQQDQQFPFTV